MSVQLVMPKAGLTMIEGTIFAWKAKEGQQVKKGEAVMEFENEKTTMDCEANADGFLHIVKGNGEVAKVGEPIAIIAETKEEYDTLQTGGAAVAATTQEAEAAPVVSQTVAVAQGGHVRATGLARNMAKSGGVDIAMVTGTGPNGRILAKDVEEYLKGAKSAPMGKQPVGDVTKTPLTGKRKSIAKNMRKAFETMAQLTVFAEVDVTELMAMRQKYVEKEDILGVRLSLNDMMMLATVKMLKKHPLLNATFDGEVITTYPYVNLGMAVGLADGLVVPVLKNADQCSLLEMSKGLRDLAVRAKEDALAGGEQSGATFTVTNVGMFHIDFGTPVISPPQVGILGFGAAKKQLVEVKGEFVPRSMMHIMLTFDHRVFDGREAGEVLGEMKLLLENPELIFV